jgi:putative ABC transport system ATP-binding protein
VEAIKARNLYRFYHQGDDETQALRGVDLTLKLGEFVALVGPSGSGKSSLIACLTGLDEPDGGVVEIMGARMSHRPEAVRADLRGHHIGMVMQVGNLIDHLTVTDNIRLSQWLNGQGTPVSELLELVGLSHRARAWPAELSGGEAARVALCVALAASPAIIVCDEPTAEVDAAAEDAILEVLNARRANGAAILIATHSQVLAARADRTITLQDGMVVS